MRDRLAIGDGGVDTDVVREYEATRRDLVRRGIAAGGITIAAAGVPTLLGARNAFAKSNDDASILRAAIGLEQTAVFAYTTAARSGKLGAQGSAAARHLAGQEQEHAGALTLALTNLGGSAPAGPKTVRDVPGLAHAARSAPGFLNFAIGLEETAVAAYYHAQQKLKDAKLLQTAVSIMANEGQHLVVLRTLARRNPVPKAFETGR